MQAAKLIGGAGTGKTSELMDIMAKTLEVVGDPFDVGFVSYTKAAVLEAARRAGVRFSVKADDLNQHDGWFRTIHAACRKILGVGSEALVNDAASEKWVAEAIQCPVEGDAETALKLWDRSRSMLQPLKPIWREASRCDGSTPTPEYCKLIIDRYEQRKRLDGRVDFTDTLARVAGVRHSLNAKLGYSQIQEEGDSPPLIAWFLDEQQDNTALLDMVVRRLVDTPECRYVYLVGDPFQSIYGFAGGHPRYLSEWQADKTRIMPRSWRCAEPIHQLGEKILKNCSDYWDRGITSAPHEGSVEATWDVRGFIDSVCPADDWLILARTNLHAKRLGKMLDAQNKPWTPTAEKISSRWQASKKVEAINGFFALEAGAPIDGRQWCEMLTYIKPAADYLKRGTKSRFARLDDPQADYPWVMPGEMYQLGVLPEFFDAIDSRAWRRWIPSAISHIEAIRNYGDDVTREPRIKVGTIHSAKGSEAENVGLLTTMAEPVIRGMATPDGYDEEQRVWYVGATRAKRRLVVLNERNRDRKGIEI